MRIEFRKGLDPGDFVLRLFFESAEDTDAVKAFIELVEKQSITDSVRIRHLGGNNSSARFVISKYGVTPL